MKQTYKTNCRFCSMLMTQRHKNSLMMNVKRHEDSCLYNPKNKRRRIK